MRHRQYGRYDAEKIGKVRTYPIPNVIIDKDTRMPTEKSLNKVLKVISRRSGQKGDITGAYVKNDNFDEMNKYAQELMKENKNDLRKKYKILSRNCMTFDQDVIEAGGEELPWMIDPRPNSYIEEIKDHFPDLFYDFEENKTYIEEQEMKSEEKQVETEEKKRKK